MKVSGMRAEKNDLLKPAPSWRPCPPCEGEMGLSCARIMGSLCSWPGEWGPWPWPPSSVQLGPGPPPLPPACCCFPWHLPPPPRWGSRPSWPQAIASAFQHCCHSLPAEKQAPIDPWALGSAPSLRCRGKVAPLPIQAGPGRGAMLAGLGHRGGKAQGIQAEGLWAWRPNTPSGCPCHSERELGQPGAVTLGLLPGREEVSPQSKQLEVEVGLSHLGTAQSSASLLYAPKCQPGA